MIFQVDGLQIPSTNAWTVTFSIRLFGGQSTAGSAEAVTMTGGLVSTTITVVVAVVTSPKVLLTESVTMLVPRGSGSWKTTNVSGAKGGITLVCTGTWFKVQMAVNGSGKS